MSGTVIESQGLATGLFIGQSNVLSFPCPLRGLLGHFLHLTRTDFVDLVFGFVTESSGRRRFGAFRTVETVTVTGLESASLLAWLLSERCKSPALFCGDGSVFHFGYTETILFGPWQIDSIGGLIGSMVAIAIFCAFFEGLKHYRAHLSQLPSSRNVEPSMWNGMHLYQTFLHAIQIVVANLIMLIFMTYNVWLCLAATLGGMCGFFFLGYKK